MKTCVVKFIRKGDSGVSYWLRPTATSIHRNATGNVTPATFSVDAVRQVGGEAVELNPSGLTIKYSYSTSALVTMPQSYIPGKTITVASNVTSYTFTLYADGVAVATITIPVISDGSKGTHGATLRGPQSWSDCANGYAFEAGGEGEEWKDVVMYGSNYYSCVKSHTKTASNYPGSTADVNNHYWQLGDKVELIATKILLASYALVKNLGVESIDMRDAAGNILFQAKGGNVTCKTGTFENIKVSGDITAEYLNLKLSTGQHYEDSPALADGSICVQGSGIILPELPVGTARSMRVLNSLQSRTTPADLVLKPATTNVRISKSLSEIMAVNANVTLSGCGANGGKYIELIGIHQPNSTTTYWLLSEMNNGLTT